MFDEGKLNGKDFIQTICQKRLNAKKWAWKQFDEWKSKYKKENIIWLIFSHI